jgi:inner membrane protein
LTATILWSALSFLPDADVIGFGLGVRYADEWGHRGATHSLAFSLAIGVAIGALGPLFRLPVVRTGLMATLILASHPLLDTLTNGGLGCALFWPFDLTRYFAPWTPIPVSPIGLGLFSPYGLFVVMAELVLFAPLFWFASLPRTSVAGPAGSERWGRRALLVGTWLIGVWLLTSSDSIRERFVRFALRDDTEFTDGFSDTKLTSIKRGQTVAHVRDRLGTPFREYLNYGNGSSHCAAVRVEGGAVAAAQPADLCSAIGIRPGMSRAAVEQTLGSPQDDCWLFSRSPDGGYFRARVVCFTDGRVRTIVRRWFRE